jgi:CBS domain-containing membrane protein
MIRRKIRRSFRKTRYIVYRQTLIDPADHLWTFIGAFAGIALIGLAHENFLPAGDSVFLIGSFGASAVLVYGAPNSPLAQPRNLVLGHFLSALTGVSVHLLLPGELWLSSAISVAASIVLMQITRSMHPPGGATALIANIGTEKIRSLGYLYALTPVLSGALILLAVALAVNNLAPHRSYPTGKRS